MEFRKWRRRREEGDQEIIHFAGPIGHLRGDVEQTVGYVSLELRRENQDGDTKLGVLKM